MANLTFTQIVNSHAALLIDGKPLEALDQYFAPDGVMYANGKLFASSAAEAHQKQQTYILAAKSIQGAIDNLIIVEELEICAFRNLTAFTSNDGAQHKINGLCWQKWRNNQIVEERYFDGEQMQALIDRGILQKPDIILNK